MGSIREWAEAICAAAVVCAAISMMVPEGKQSKCMKTVLSVMLLCLLVSPLSKLNDCSGKLKDYITEPPTGNSELSELIEQQTASAMSDAVSGLVAGTLEEMNIAADKISVQTDISQDGCISIGQVIVEVNGDDYPARERIADSLYRQLGLQVQIVAAEEE